MLDKRDYSRNTLVQTYFPEIRWNGRLSTLSQGDIAKDNRRIDHKTFCTSSDQQVLVTGRDIVG